MAHVFISYVRENRDIVDRLAKELSISGVTVWLDRTDIEHGPRWKDAIKRAIRSGKFFIACFSKEFNQRDRSPLHEELTIAIEELRARPSERTWFIPVLLNEALIPTKRISSAEDLSDLRFVRLYENWDEGICSIVRILRYDVLARIRHLSDIIDRSFDEERLHAIRELGDIRPVKKLAIVALLKAFKDTSPEIRIASVNALARVAQVGMGPAAAEAVPALVAALGDDPHRYVRRRAADALGEIGPAAAEAVPALVAALGDDPHREVREAAAWALGEVWPAGAVPALVAALRDDPHGEVREAAAWVLGEVWPAWPACLEAMPALAGALVAALRDDPHGEVREAAAWALMEIGPAFSREVVPALVAALVDPDEDIRRVAARALREIGSAAVRPLVAALDDPDEDIRRAAAWALMEIMPAAEELLAAAVGGVRKKTAAKKAAARKAAAKKATAKKATARNAVTPPAPLQRRKPQDDAKYLVWYGTNRKPIDPNDSSKGYSGDRDQQIHLGTCEVFIPKSHKIGSTGSSWWERFKTAVDDRLKLIAINELGTAEYWAKMSAHLNSLGADERDALVFVHGYNVSFENAALRAAQIGFDLSIQGAMAFFSWPSQGKLGGYTADEASIEASEPWITDFMADFAARSGAARVHIIAHSMGNRGVLRALDRITTRTQERTGTPFDQIILAAADVDADTFRNLCAAYARVSRRTTLYVSSRDLAVEASRWLHAFPRAGLLPPIMVVPGIDTINVTNADLTALGHGYVAEVRDVLQDIHRLLVHGDPPGLRFGLREDKTDAGEPFWVIGL